MDAVREWFKAPFEPGSEVQMKLLTTVAAIILLWLLRRLVLRLVTQRIEDVRLQYRWRKASGYVSFVIGLLIVGPIWFEGVQSLSTVLGLVGAGVAIALQDPLVNLAGWAFIVWRRPFGVGDRIQIGDYCGDVIDQRIFMFTLLEIGNWVHADQSTGRVIHIPNGKIFRDMLANYSTGFEYIWHEIPVLITFESDWRKAKEVLTGIVRRHAKDLSEGAAEKVRHAAEKYLIFYTKLTPTVYTTVQESGVLLTIRYLCVPRQRRGTEQAIWEDILDRFGTEPAIDFAYPTRRFYTLPSSEGAAETAVSSGPTP